MLSTDKQKGKLTNATKNITSFAKEVTNYGCICEAQEQIVATCINKCGCICKQIVGAYVKLKSKLWMHKQQANSVMPK